MYRHPSGTILNLAHRGASGHAPENTLAAFRLAREMGADGAELDVQLTADGVPVVFHDEGLVRLLGVRDEVRSRSLKALRRLSFGAKFGPRFDGERIPTLDEALEALDGLIVNIELKGEGLPRKDLCGTVAGVVRDHAMDDRVIVSSFNPLLIALFRAAAPGIATAFLFDPEGRFGIRGPWAGYALGTPFLNPRKDCVTPGRVAAWHARGLGVMAWTVNDAAEMRRVARCGADAIITNHPDRLKGVLGAP